MDLQGAAQVVEIKIDNENSYIIFEQVTHIIKSIRSKCRLKLNTLFTK